MGLSPHKNFGNSVFIKKNALLKKDVCEVNPDWVARPREKDLAGRRGGRSECTH